MRRSLQRHHSLSIRLINSWSNESIRIAEERFLPDMPLQFLCNLFSIFFDYVQFEQVEKETIINSRDSFWASSEQHNDQDDREHCDWVWTGQFWSRDWRIDVETASGVESTKNRKNEIGRIRQTIWFDVMILMTSRGIQNDDLFSKELTRPWNLDEQEITCLSHSILCGPVTAGGACPEMMHIYQKEKGTWCFLWWRDAREIFLGELFCVCANRVYSTRYEMPDDADRLYCLWKY